MMSIQDKKNEININTEFKTEMHEYIISRNIVTWPSSCPKQMILINFLNEFHF